MQDFYSFYFPFIIFLSSCPFLFLSFLPFSRSWRCVLFFSYPFILFPCPPVLSPALTYVSLFWGKMPIVPYILIFPVLGAGICRVPCPSSWTRGPPPPSSPLPSDLATIPIFSWQSHASFPFLPCSLPIPILHLSRYSYFFAKIHSN